MNRVLSILLSLVAAFVMVTPIVSAAEATLRGFSDGNSVLMAASQTYDSSADAKLIYRQITVRQIEQQFAHLGLRILQSEELSITARQNLRLDEGRLHEVRSSRLGSGVLLTARSGKNVNIVMGFGAPLDSDDYLQFCFDVVTGDLKKIRAPRGYSEIHL